MTWLYRFLGLRTEQALLVQVPSGDGGQLIGNPHGRPDHVLVAQDGVLRSWPIADITTVSRAAEAWLAGYLQGFVIDAVDVWPEAAQDAQLDEGAPYELESACRTLSTTLHWHDPPTAEVSLARRASPFDDMRLDEYCDRNLVGAFLAASDVSWWARFEWHFTLEAIINEGSWRDHVDEPDDFDGWLVQDVIDSRIDRIAACYMLLGEDGFGRRIASTADALNRQPIARYVGFDKEYPVGLFMVGGEIRKRPLSRSWGSHVVNVDEGPAEHISSIIPVGPQSAWWLRGYLAGREPSIGTVTSWAGHPISFPLWRLMVFHHHLVVGHSTIVDLDTLHRILPNDRAGSTETGMVRQ